MSDEFKYLFTPFTLGSITVPNRIMSTGHITQYAKDNLPSEQHAYYYAEKAKGGVGLITIECQAVHITTQPYQEIVYGWDERVIPGYQRISSMVHEHGAKILAQLWHAGHHSLNIHNMREGWAPSAIASVTRCKRAKAMEIEDIQEVVAGFATVARNLQAGGFDGAEIHAASGYLLQQFLSPLANKRTDEYGGSLDNRLRFTLEVIDAIRATVGRDFVLGIRIAGDELVPGGLTQDDMKLVAQKLEATGKLDFINVTVGNYQNLSLLVPPMFVPLGFAAYLASGIKQVVDSIPVFTCGRINDPLLAEKILADGHADMVGMTRATIADPELPIKAREGRLDDIRTCIACNEGCIGRRWQGKWMSCLQNVAAGREKELGIGTLQPATVVKKVMVVGGGPGGMEAARVAALRGHQVSLYEKQDTLGGQINTLTRVKSREEFGGATRWLGNQIAKLGVDIHLNSEVTQDLVDKVQPDVVVVATGSTPVRTGFTSMRPELEGIPGANQDNVLTVWDVLLDPKPVGQKVVLIDDDHDFQAATAEFLALQGKQVEIICRFPSISQDVALTLGMPFVYRALLNNGVTFTPNTWCRRIEGNCVVVYNLYNNVERIIEDAYTVVLAAGNEANDGLYRQLKSTKRPGVYAIGDCLAPRKCLDAIFDGHRLARQI